jgi:ribose transport system substrate-binding protein
LGYVNFIGEYMKRSLKIILLVLIISLCTGFIGYSYNFNAIQIRLVGSKVDKGQNKPHYHFVIIAQDTEDDFWQSVKKGVDSAAAELGASVEFNGPVIRNEDDELEYLNIAIASHVDGIVVYVPDEAKFTPLINEATAEGIHVITIESDAENSTRITCIGVNSFNAGFNAGTLVTEASNGKSNVALILSGNYLGDSNAENTLLSGFKFSTASYPGIQLQAVKTSDTGYFGAEKTFRDILNNYPNINTVVCTSSDDTLEITQVLIDLNKVGKITVIGYNITSQIRDYIENGVIYGAVVEDPVQIGYHSIQSLVDSLNGKHVDDFIDTGVNKVTRGNLLQYLANP